MTDSPKILVVIEDEPDVRMMIHVLLSADPRIEIVGEAARADEAIELARTQNPGLIILDHSIEGDVMGIEAAPMLKKVAPAAKILLFTAFDVGREAAAEPAIDEFLPKSKVGELLATVQRMLELG